MKIGHQIILTWVGILKMKNEREMFEAWAKPRKYVLIGATVDGVFSYLNQKTNIAWDSWQASAQRQGYKLVPVEPTIAMVRAYYETPKPTASRCYQAMIGVSE